MDRDNLRARLENISRLSVTRKVEEYEKLFENHPVQKVEEFAEKKGEDVVVLEVRRRVRLLYLLASDLGLDPVAKRAKALLNHF
jgi:hypothetical protein